MAYSLHCNRHFLAHKLDYVHQFLGYSRNYRTPSVLICIISAVLTQYATIRQTFNTQHFIIVIRKSTYFCLHETTIIRLQFSKYKKGIDIRPYRLEAAGCTLWIPDMFFFIID